MEKFKKIRNYLFAFILPFLLCLVIFYFKGILGDIENMYISDLRSQHIVFLSYLKNVLLGEADVVYSFYAGIGSSMISTIIFYCLSPINLILLLIEDIRYAILFIYIVKISLSGLTMFTLLKSKMNCDNHITVLFSTCYALGAFVINYFFCGFWFDSLYLAPLVTLGIDKIIRHEKMSLLYIGALCLAIICNIQMGFGLCIYSVIYFLYSYCVNYNIKKDFKKFKQLIFVFIISSLCAGAISSGALLGFGFEYANISTARDIEVDTTSGVANLGIVLKNFFTVGSLKEDYFNNYEPFIYCGLLVSFFSVLYFFNQDIEKRKKQSAFVVIMIFLISFSIKFINLFWHLSSPVLLNFRYSGYLSLFLTMLAYECYLKKQKLTKKDISVLSFLFLIASFVIVGYSAEVYVIWTFVFLILIFVGILLVKNKNKKFEVLLLVLVISEIFMNGYLSIYTSSQLPFEKDTSYDTLNEVASWNSFDDNYRVMYNYTYTDYMGDALLVNQNSSLRYFSSVINGNLLKFFDRNLSVVGNNNYRISAYDSPLLLSLMGNKYMYLTEELNNSIYKKVDSYQIDSYDYESAKMITKDVYLYDNPYALSLGYIIEKDVDYVDSMDLVDYQNEMIKSFSGIDKDAVIRLDFSVSSDSEYCSNSEYITCNTYTITNPTNNVLINAYGMFDRYTLPNTCKIYLDVNRPVLISTIDKVVDLTFEYNGFLEDSERFVASTYNNDNLIESLSHLQENMLTNIEIDGDTLVGKINSSKSGILFLSIPYDKNFEISVDGVLVDYYSLLNDTFIGLDLEEGEHDIKLQYVDKKVKWYVISTIISIIVTVILYYFINKKIKKRIEAEEKIREQRIKEQKMKQEKINEKKRKKRK